MDMNLLPEKAEEPRVIEAEVTEVLQPGQLSAAEKLRFQGAAVRIIFRGMPGGGFENWFGDEP